MVKYASSISIAKKFMGKTVSVFYRNSHYTMKGKIIAVTPFFIIFRGLTNLRVIPWGSIEEIVVEGESKNE